MKNLLMFVIVTCVISSCTENEKKCIISGNVIGRPQSEAILLQKVFDDLRSEGVVRIPIKDSTFTHEITFKYPEAYQLVFEDEYKNGIMRPIIFFLTDGEINMELYSMRKADTNQINGGHLNNEYFGFLSYWDSVYEKQTKQLKEASHSLFDIGKYFSDTMNIVINQLRETKNQEERDHLYKLRDKIEEAGLAFSSPVKELERKMNKVVKTITSEQCYYIKKHPSVVTYFILIKTLKKVKSKPEAYDLEIIESTYYKLAKRYKNHPYTDYGKGILWNLENIIIGGSCFDFTLNDIEGNEFTFSNEINGKYALLDIWAPWCGSCIRTSRRLKPVFEEFRNRDFTVIGVASQFKSIDNVKNILEREKYPWITLIDEPEKESQISSKYDTKMRGGRTILIDQKGKIIAVDPTADEIREILSKTLK